MQKSRSAFTQRGCALAIHGFLFLFDGVALLKRRACISAEASHARLTYSRLAPYRIYVFLKILVCISTINRV